MRFNWGTGITIGIVLFMAFILFMVFKATQTDSDLNAENYYEQEMAYQERIDAIANAAPFKNEVDVQQIEGGLEITYPAELVEEGTVHLFRPDNAGLDVWQDMNPTLGKILIDQSKTVPGRYDVRLSWKQDGALFFIEKSVVIQ